MTGVWDLSADDCVAQLNSNLRQGLSSDEVQKRQAEFGLNELEAEEKTPLWELILEQFDDVLVKILLAAAGLSFVLAFFEEHEGMTAFVEPFVILLILFINAFVGVWQESNAENALEALKKLQSASTACLRDGQWIEELECAQLVPGDIVKVQVGDKVPADLRVLELLTTTIRTDEGSLTGESATVMKHTDPLKGGDSIKIQEKKNMMFAGTTIANGRAYCMIVQTGMNTEIGKIQQDVQKAAEDEEKTPLNQKLDQFGEQLTYVIAAICVLVWAMNLSKFSDPIHGGMFGGCIYYMKIAVALGVAAIPEGLPAVITLCLALGTRKMVKRNAIVRKLPSVETLGCCTVICSDKTGTLTTNQMAVVQFFQMGKDEQDILSYTVEGIDYSPMGDVQGLDVAGDSDSVNVLAQVCSLCNEARVLFNTEEDKYERFGEPTEAALKVLVEKLKLGGGERSNKQDSQFFNEKITSQWTKEATLEFSRDRKSMSVLCSQDGKNRTLFVKGAPDNLLPRCTKVMLKDGSVQKLTKAGQDAIAAYVSEMARSPLRCLAYAIKGNMQSKEALNDYLLETTRFKEVEVDMIFVGVTGIKDPARLEVKDAIASCNDAGIRVMMITGDNKETAQAIAKDVGIFDRDISAELMAERSFTGAEFFSFPEEKQVHLLMHNGGSRVFSRTEPRDKQSIVKLLKDQGEVPAMTGDGVNDAPALKSASIGIAMGIAGTEVAKEASDMILADDNFATIVHAVEEGRSIYSNMKAFIRYMISSNMGEVASVFFTAAMGVPEGLIPVQLLWVNLVTDGPPATALGFNPPDADVMKNPPRGEEDVLINTWVFFRYLIIGLYVGFATVGIFVFWFIYYADYVDFLNNNGMKNLGSTYDGHSMIQYNQLANWGKCKEGQLKGTIFEGFKVNNFDAQGQGVIHDFSAKPCAYFQAGKTKASTLSLTVLVTIEMFNALNAISEDGSLLSTPPWVNPWLLLAMAASFAMHFVILYIPFLAGIFTIAPHDGAEWLLVFLFSFPVIIIDEVLKMVGRAMATKERAARKAAQAKKLKEA